MRPKGISDHVLYGVLGAGVGMLFSCCLGVAVLALLGGSPEVAMVQPPTEYDIEAIVEEDYINRTMLDNADSIPMPLSMVAGHLDIHPGGLGDFTVQMELGPLRPVFEGTVTLRATEEGWLEVEVVEVRAGYLTVTPFVPSGLTAEVNQAVNQMFAKRTAGTGVRLVGIASDDTTLRFYLVSEP